MKARNENLENYLNDMIETRRLRWQYLRSRSERKKIGLLVTFVEKDNVGRKVLWVGVSKVNLSAHDTFQLDTGLVKAIQSAISAEAFLDMYENNPNWLPRLPLTWKNDRDEQGYITGSVTWYNQYDQFVNRLRKMVEAYYNLQLT